MPKISVDFEAAGIVPNGELTLRVEKAKFKASKAGNPKIDLQLRILGGEFDKQMVFDSLMLGTRRLIVTKQALKAFLGKVPAGSELDTDELCQELIGTEAQCLVEVEPGSEGYEPRARVAKYGI